MAVPLWSEIESVPEFSTLSPEEKAQTADTWLNDALTEVDDPTEVLQLSALLDTKKRSFLGQPVSENPVQDLAGQRFANRQAVSNRYKQFAAGEVEDPDLLALDQVFKDRQDSIVLNGNLFLKPSLVWDREQYQKVVKESQASPTEKAFALTEYEPMRENASKAMVEQLSVTDAEFKDFAKTGYAAGRTNTEILDSWREAMKLPDSLMGTAQGIGRQLLYGAQGGLAGLARAGAGVAQFFGSEDAQKAAEEAGKEAASFAARRQIEGGPSLVGEVAEGATSLIPTLAVGAAGAALAPVTGGTSLAPAAAFLTGMGAAAGVAGLQSLGGSTADAYEFYRDTRGLSPEEAAVAARKDGVASFLITSTVTALAGRLGEKLGLGRGVEGLFRNAGSRAAIRSSLKTGVMSVFGNATEEAIEEATDQLLQGVYERAVRDPNKDFATIVEETVQAAKIGGILGGGLQAGKVGINRLFKQTGLDADPAQLEAELAARQVARENPAVQQVENNAANLSAAAANAQNNNAPAVAQVTEKLAQDTLNQRNALISSLSRGIEFRVPGVTQIPFAPSPAVAPELQQVEPQVPPAGQLELGLNVPSTAPTVAPRTSRPAQAVVQPDAAQTEFDFNQPPTPTTDATLQGQVPENRVEERQDVDEGGPTAETGGGNRPVQGGQVQAQEVTVAPVQPTQAAPATGELPAPQAEVVSPEGVTPPQPLPPTGGVPTESLPAGQPTSGDVGTALRAVATNTATPEQVASLEAQGLARTVQGQPVITDAGLAQMPEAERPRLTEAERVAEIEAQAAPAGEPAPAPAVERMPDEKFATFEGLVKARKAAGTLSKEMAAKYREQLVLRGRAPAQRKAPATKKAPAAKKPAGERPAKSSRRAAADKKVADAMAEFKRIARAAAREDRQIAGMGGIPVGTLRRTPELIAATVKLTTALVDSGIVRFSDFAAEIYAALPDLWDSVKGIALEAWQLESEFNPEMEQVDDATAEEIFAEIEATPVEEAPVEEAPVEETPVEEAPVEEAPAADTLDSENPVGEAPTAEDANALEKDIPPLDPDATLGFGAFANKSINQLVDEEETNFLFTSLFDDQTMKDALAGENRAKVIAARKAVELLPEFEAYRESLSRNDEDWRLYNAENSEKAKTSVETLNSLGIKASIDEAGRVVLDAKTLPSTLKKKGKKDSILKTQFGFFYDTKAQSWVTRDFQNVIDLAESLKLDAQGQLTTARRKSKLEQRRDKFRDDLEAQDDESVLNAEEPAEYLPKEARNTLFEGAKNGGTPKSAIAVQAHDAALIVKAQQTGKPMFLLASGAGTGKTYIIAAAIAGMRKRGVKGRILFVAMNDGQVQQSKEVFAKFGVTDVQFITYSAMDDAKRNPAFDTDVLIFDEVHNVRYRGGDVAATRANIAGEWMERSKFTLMASATPYESVEQMHFLWRTGVFGLVQDRKYRDFEKGWYNFANLTGAKIQRRSTGEPKGTNFAADMPEEDLRNYQLAARMFLAKNGMFVRRESELDPKLLESNLAAAPAAQEMEQLAEKIKNAADVLGGADFQTRAYVTNLLKRIAEYAKLPTAIELARKQLEENPNRRVVIFVETKSESVRDLQAAIDDWDAVASGKKPELDPTTVNIEGVIDLYRELVNQGVTSITLPSAKQAFIKGLGEENVGFYTGDETAGQRKTIRAEWEGGEKRVLVSTIGAGGTGLSFHDEVGGMPRSQIVVTLPWRGTETDQVSRRTFRYGVKSPVRSFWLFAPSIPGETKLIQRVADRLKSMSTLVNGEVSEFSKEVGKSDFDLAAYQNGIAEAVEGIAAEIFATPSKVGAGIVAMAEELQAYLSGQPFPGNAKDRVSRTAIDAGIKLLSKTIPNIEKLVTVLPSSQILSSNAFSGEVKEIVRAGGSGFYYKGKAYVVEDQVYQQAYHQTPEIAAAAVAFHEVLHGGMDLIRNNPKFAGVYAQWKAMVNENVSGGDIDRLVRTGYTYLSGWRDNSKTKFMGAEEVFVRKLDELLSRKGEMTFGEQNLVSKFLSWVKRLLNSVFGTPTTEKMSDDLLRDWGRKVIDAVNSAQFVANAKKRTEDSQSIAQFSIPELPEGSRRTPLDTFTQEQLASIEAAKNSSNVPGFDSFAQILGQVGAGELKASEQLAPLVGAAMEHIGFTVDGASGQPVVTAAASAKARSIALQLLNPKSGFGERYQSQFGSDSAATAVLQMELTRYALAMLGKGDSSLIGMLRKNWNSVVLGAYLSATAAGRVLRARSMYVSDVLRTIEELEAAQTQLVEDNLGKKGVANAAGVLESINRAVSEALMDKQARDSLRKSLQSDPRSEELDAMEDERSKWLRGIELLPDRLRARYIELTAIAEELAFLEAEEKRLTQKPDGETAAASILRPAGTSAVSAKFAPLSSINEIELRRKELADRAEVLNREDLEEDDVGGGPPLEDPTDDENDLEDADGEEPNEDTQAAQKVLDELEAFLKKKYSKNPPPPTAYTLIRGIIEKKIANTNEYPFSAFRADVESALSQFDIEADTQEELIARAWTVFVRKPEKLAQKIAARFEELSKGLNLEEKLEPSKVTALKDLIRTEVRNKNNLPAQDFVDQLLPKLNALTVTGKDAESLAVWTYRESVRRKTEQRTRKIQAIKDALMQGSNSRLVKKLTKATEAEKQDNSWKRATLLEVLKNSGLAPSEAAQVAATFTKDEFDHIFGESETLAEAKNAQKLKESVARLVKKYEERVKRPKPPKETRLRQFTLATLAKNQLNVPLDRDIFVAEARALGATDVQANHLFDLVAKERELFILENQNRVDKSGRKLPDRRPTLTSRLVTYLLSGPASIINSPENRELAIREFLLQNGIDEARVNDMIKWIAPQFTKYVKEAKQQALEAHIKKLTERKVVAEKQGFVSLTASSLKQLDSDLAIIRKGLADFEADPTQSLAKALGFEGFRKEDYQTLSELDRIITRARENGMAHDMARGLKELYELLARRKAPKSWQLRMAISYNNSALSGVGTLAINIVAPGGALVIRFGIDIFRAITTGNFQQAADFMRIFATSFNNIAREISFSLVGGANVNAMQQQVSRVTNMQNEFNIALKVLKDPKKSVRERTVAAFQVAQAATDVTRRVLAATDHTWYAVMQNYFLRTEALRVLTDKGIRREISMPILFANAAQQSNALAQSLSQIQEAREYFNSALAGSPGAFVDKINQFIATNPPAGLSRDMVDFDFDLRASVRRTLVAYVGTNNPKTIHRYLMQELSVQENNAYLRASDLLNKQMLTSLQGLVDPDGDQRFAENTETFSALETEYELGTHRGEDSPALDIFNMASNVIVRAGSHVLRDQPTFGRMMLGFFGIPINLLNRAMWFTPYGLYRYKLASKVIDQKTGAGAQKFYQQSMATQAQIRQRLVEAVVGTTGTMVLIALQTLAGDDEEDRLFNITLAGPVNKTEYDAWYKQGNRRNSINANIGGMKASINWGRGPLEPIKVALMLVGAMDDMRLNRKMGDTGLQISMTEYLSAVLSGWSQQASFFGAKTTIGAVFQTQADTSAFGNLLYKLNPLMPFSGLVASVERFIKGPNQFRGRESAVFANLPVLRTLFTERAVNALGDPLGNSFSDPFSALGERAWYAGLPFTLQKRPEGKDFAVYQFILDRGVAPGLPQRSALESKNGLMWDSDWQRYVEYRGGILKSEIARNLARLNRMSDDDLPKAIAELSTRATKQAKRRFNYQ